MFKFFYHIQFNRENEQFHIRIYLSLNDLYIPVYNNSYNSEVLDVKETFERVYREVEGYFKGTKVKMDKDDLRLFYYTLTNFDIPTPSLEAIIVESLDPMIKTVEDELTPKEKLFLIQMSGKSNEGIHLVDWESEYQNDPIMLMNKLEQRDYLSTIDYVYNIEQSSVDELMNLLKMDVDRNEMINVAKHQLMKGILSTDRIHNYIKLTKKGKLAILDSMILSDFHTSPYRHNGVSIDEFYLVSLLKPIYSADAICKLMVVNQSSDDFSAFNWQDIFKPEQVKVPKINSTWKESTPIERPVSKATIASPVSPTLDVNPTKVEQEEFSKIINKYDKVEQANSNFNNERVKLRFNENDNQTEAVLKGDFFQIISKYGKLEMDPMIDPSDEALKQQQKLMSEKDNPVIHKLKNDIKSKIKNDEDIPITNKFKFLQLFWLQFGLSTFFSIVILYYLYYYVF